MSPEHLMLFFEYSGYGFAFGTGVWVLSFAVHALFEALKQSML